MKQPKFSLTHIMVLLWVMIGIGLFYDLTIVKASTPAQDWAPPNTTGSHLRMRRLYSNGKSMGEDCLVGDMSYGCTAFCNNDTKCSSSVRPYTYTNAWPDISFDKDDLLDVVGQESSPGLFDPVALQAPAIAARSYAWYQINNADKYIINNSTSFQVFLPFKFETFGPDPDNASDSCQSTNLSSNQTKLCDAVGTGTHYLSWDAITNTAFLPALANFFSDVLERTTSSSDKAYLSGVADPISNNNATCSASNSAAHSWGMSQTGAQRWATGDQCGILYRTRIHPGVCVGRARSRSCFTTTPTFIFETRTNKSSRHVQQRSDGTRSRLLVHLEVVHRPYGVALTTRPVYGYRTLV